MAEFVSFETQEIAWSLSHIPTLHLINNNFRMTFSFVCSSHWAGDDVNKNISFAICFALCNLLSFAAEQTFAAKNRNVYGLFCRFNWHKASLLLSRGQSRQARARGILRANKFMSLYSRARAKCSDANQPSCLLYRESRNLFSQLLLRRSAIATPTMWREFTKSPSSSSLRRSSRATSRGWRSRIT